MKKIFGMMAALLLIMGCDDGDMTFKTFNFGNATVQSCTSSGIVFKVSGTQALILDLAPAAFLDIVTTAGNPRVITLNATNRLIYRNYDANVGSTSLCSTIPPATPSVVEEWMALPGGTITIVTSKRENADGDFVGYNHTITLLSVTFTRGEETIIVEDNVFGTYSETLPYSFNFLDEGNDVVFTPCTPNSSTIFRVVGNETLLLSLAPGVFPSTPGTTTPVDLANTSDANQVVFTRYEASASTALFCSSPPPVLNVTGQWLAVAGQIKLVTTGAAGGGYDHKVFLVNAIFRNTDGEEINVKDGDNPEYQLGTYHTN